MTTHMYLLAESIDSRLNELNTIADRAAASFDADKILYDILCRAGSVLAVSALEGFLKDLNVAIQTDLNINISSFSMMPANMKREFSTKIVYFEGVKDSDIQKRVAQLIKFFDRNTVDIDLSAFSYKENTNKNPTSNLIDGAFVKYGINSVLHCLAGSRFEVVFDSDSATDLVLKREIKRLRSTVYSFPYKKLCARYEMQDWAAPKGQTAPASIWHTFIENLLQRRHSVVHADTSENPTS